MKQNKLVKEDVSNRAKARKQDNNHILATPLGKSEYNFLV